MLWLGMLVEFKRGYCHSRLTGVDKARSFDELWALFLDKTILYAQNWVCTPQTSVVFLAWSPKTRVYTFAKV